MTTQTKAATEKNLHTILCRRLSSGVATVRCAWTFFNLSPGRTHCLGRDLSGIGHAPLCPRQDAARETIKVGARQIYNKTAYNPAGSRGCTPAKVTPQQLWQAQRL